MITRIWIVSLIVVSFCRADERTDNSGNTFPAAKKCLSIELYGGQYYTNKHRLEPLDTRLPWSHVVFEELPSSMWRAGGRIRYRMAQHVALSLDIGYGSTQDIVFIYSSYIIPPRFKFTITQTSCAISYTNRPSKGLDYYVGVGLVAIYTSLYGDDMDQSDNDTMMSAFYLSPIVNGSLGFYLFPRFCIRAQAEAKLHHLLKTGAEKVHLPDILPSITLGIEYTLCFNQDQSN